MTMTDKEKESENIHLVIPKPQIGDPEEIIDKEDPNFDPKIIQEQNNKYFLEFGKLYEANLLLKSQLNSLTKEKNLLKHNVQKLESKHLKKGNEKIEINDMYTNRRRKRRTKNEISRNYVCPDSSCQKSYGSEGSLNQHIKLKHKHLII